MSLVTFSPLPVRTVLQGRGAVECLPEALDSLGVRRALLVTGRSLSERTDVVARLGRLLGERLVGVYGAISQHTPSGQIIEAAQQARGLGVDGLLSLGGGSPIDGAKAVAYVLSRGITSREQLLRPLLTAHHGPIEGPLVHPPLPHVVLPTTLSAAECSYSLGFTDEQAKMKTGLADRSLAPAAVIYDPELTIHTPGWLWATTGMRAIDHAVESLYAPERQPLTDVLAQEALRLLFEHLEATAAQEWREATLRQAQGERSEWRVFRRETQGRPPGWSEPAEPTTPVDAEEALGGRLLCQQGAWFSFYGSTSLRMGMSHALGRRIGARFDVPHGHTSALTLPAVMRAKVAEVPDRLRLVAQAVGVDSPELTDGQAAERAAQAVADLATRLKLPTRLSEVGILESDLAWIAEGRAAVVELLRVIL